MRDMHFMRQKMLERDICSMRNKREIHSMRKKRDIHSMRMYMYIYLYLPIRLKRDIHKTYVSLVLRLEYIVLRLECIVLQHIFGETYL